MIIPHVRIDWNHEYLNDADDIEASFVNGSKASDNSFDIPTDDPDRDYFNFGIGSSATFPRGIAGFVYFETPIELEDVTYYVVSFGLRFEI